MLDTRTPSVARAYDYLLGGGASFAADRALAGRLAALYPQLAGTLLSSRTHVADAVARIARQGVDQYLDVGAGLPTRPSTHATARALVPAARVVYIDRDPVVVAHGTALVPPGVRYQVGDLTEPEALLAALTLSSTSPGRSAWCSALVSRRSSLAPPGPSSASWSRRCRRAATWWRPSARAMAGRLPDSVWPAGATEADLASFFGGLDLLPPGITGHGEVLCGTGVKPRPADGGPPNPVAATEIAWMRLPPASSSRRRTCTPRRPRSWSAPTAGACSSTRR